MGNKPDWKNAPDWANYVARDADGCWYWFENKPELDRGVYFTHGKIMSIDLVNEFEPICEERPDNA